MTVINGIDYSDPSQFTDTGSSSTPTVNLRPISPTSTGGGSGGGGTYGSKWTSGATPSPNRPTPTVNLLMTRQIQNMDDPASASLSEDSGYSISDAELFNMQLENAYLMQSLGYDVDFQGKEMVYSKSPEQYQPSVYGAYGQQSSPYIYESDYLLLQQQRAAPQYYHSYGNYPQEWQYEPYQYNGQRYNNDYSGYNGYNGYNRYNKSRWQKNKRWRGGQYANRYNTGSRSRRAYSWF